MKVIRISVIIDDIENTSYGQNTRTILRSERIHQKDITNQELELIAKEDLISVSEEVLSEIASILDKEKITEETK